MNNKIIAIAVAVTLTGCATLEQAGHERDLCMAKRELTPEACEIAYRERLVEVDRQQQAATAAAALIAVGVAGALASSRHHHHHYVPHSYKRRR